MRAVVSRHHDSAGATAVDDNQRCAEQDDRWQNWSVRLPASGLPRLGAVPRALMEDIDETLRLHLAL
jgi:hypothetical protein